MTDFEVTVGILTVSARFGTGLHVTSHHHIYRQATENKAFS
jgi:hypothetical protein